MTEEQGDGGPGSPEARLAALGLALPKVTPPVAAYLPAVRTGGYVYTAGQLPVIDGQLLATGKVGAGVSAEEARALARTCALNALAAVASVTGGLEAVRRIVKVTGFVASAPDFTQQAQVINGASELLIEVFGEAGKHARSAVGMAVLPLDAPVEVEHRRGRFLEWAPGRIRLRGQLGEHVAEVLAGRRPPAPPRDAATVMLLRPGQDATGSPGGAGGLEVYLLRRKASMAFAPGAYVFPGGSVDPRDADQEVAWAGPGPAEWGRTLDAPPELARALVCAAVRETFEESGVLLAGPSADRVVADTSGADWEADRTALLDRSLSLAGLLRRRGLVLRADLLRPWSRWITPEAEERRYDTRFFAAALPSRQRTRDVGGEADQVAWVRPADAIAMGRRKEIMLMPPTAVTLAELAQCPGVDAALTTQRPVRPLRPEVTVEDGIAWLSLPPGLEYPA